MFLEKIMKLKDLLSNKIFVGILFVFFPFILMGESCWKYNYSPIGLIQHFTQACIWGILMKSLNLITKKT